MTRAGTAFSKEELVISWLLKGGCHEIQGEKQFRKFRHPAYPTSPFWAGRHGALRFGNSVSGSCSLHMVVALLVEIGAVE